MNPYVNRLYNEWCRHKKIIIKVNFDDTVCPVTKAVPDYSERVLVLLRKCQPYAHIMLDTTRMHRTYVPLVNYMKTHSIKVDSVCTSPVNIPFHDTGFANITLDDRAGLLEAMDILEEALEMYVEYTLLKKQIS